MLSVCGAFARGSAPLLILKAGWILKAHRGKNGYHVVAAIRDHAVALRRYPVLTLGYRHHGLFHSRRRRRAKRLGCSPLAQSVPIIRVIYRVANRNDPATKVWGNTPRGTGTTSK